MNSKTKFPLLKIGLGILVVLLALAVLIPNLLRSRMTGDPASPAAAAVMNIHAISIAEITYYTNYPKVGYAPNLSVLGPDVPDYAQCHQSPEHACQLDQKVACPSGTGAGWCVKGIYRYNVQSSSTEAPYKDYWVTATPVRADAGLKNLCSGPDAVVRKDGGPPLSRPYLTLDECLALEPISSF